MEAALLKLVRSWQRWIIADLSDRYACVDRLELKFIAQQVILAVVWLLLVQQRSIASAQTITSLRKGHSLYSQLGELLRVTSAGLTCDNPFVFPAHLTINDKILRSILTNLDRVLQNSPHRLLSDDILGRVYEQLLGNNPPVSSTVSNSVCCTAVDVKKNQGIYYTPVSIVHYIIQNTVGVALKQKNNIQILDLACGGGAFLLVAYQFLLDWHLEQYLSDSQIPKHGKCLTLQQQQDGQWRLSFDERRRILLHFIYGVDLDPQAVKITQLGLWLKLLEDIPIEDLPDRQVPSLPDLSHNILVGNALTGIAIDQATASPDLQPFLWQQVFPHVFQSDRANSGGFDVVIGNPPYIDSEQMTLHSPQWRHYCNQHYRTATGNWDLFCIFIEQALNVCRRGGMTSLVVPNKLASAGYAGKARRLLSQENTLVAVRDYSQVAAFAAAVYPLVYIAQKLPTVPDAAVKYELMQDLEQVSQVRSLHLHPDNPEHPWLLTTQSQSIWLLRLQQTLRPLKDFVAITGAATVEEAYRFQSLISECSAPAVGDLQMINSGTIDRYCNLWGQKPMRYLGKSYLHPIIAATQVHQLPLKRQQQATRAKLIVAGLTQRLECTLDQQGIVLAGKSTSIIWAAEQAIDLRYLLGVLNSRLLSFYFTRLFQGNCLQGGYFRVGPPQLRQLPIVDPANLIHEKNYRDLIEVVEQKLTVQANLLLGNHTNGPAQLQQWNNHLDRAIDQQVYQLYQLTDREIEEIETTSPYA